jgi:hypothetical protein
MRFEARDLKPAAEPVDPGSLKEGKVYWAVTFFDDDMLIPNMEPLVFAGRNLGGDDNSLYFQDIDSYRRGVRYGTPSHGGPATFHSGDAVNHMFEFDRALDVILSCSIRRQKRGAD